MRSSGSSSSPAAATRRASSRRRARSNRPTRSCDLPPPAAPILTVGHSTRTLAEFLELLRAHRVARLIDVRTIPRSRRHPHFNTEALAASLPQAGIAYTHLPALGGL